MREAELAPSFHARIPFADHLGLELLRSEGGEAEIALTLREELTNSWRIAHGGVSMTLLDVTMAQAARSAVPPGGASPSSVATVEMKTSFLRPGTGRLLAKARLLHRTATMAFCEGSLLDEGGALVAHATGTFKYLRGLPVGGRRIERPDASD